MNESLLWADCWYPWLDNGWIKCDCGEWFHSRPGASATVQHAQHAKEAHHA